MQKEDNTEVSKSSPLIQVEGRGQVEPSMQTGKKQVDTQQSTKDRKRAAKTD